MPRYTTRQEKFKCKEIACGLIVRGDKWNAHCKSHHGYAMKQGREIKKETISVKEGDGPWTRTVLTLHVGGLCSCIMIYNGNTVRFSSCLFLSYATILLVSNLQISPKNPKNSASNGKTHHKHFPAYFVEESTD